MLQKYEKWLWIELIGFDNRKKDFGVNGFLDRTGFIPQGISLLLWDSDLIHSHDRMNKDGLLGEKKCAYGARPYNEERKRQNWTKYQLRGLISLLHDSGIEVYLSIFDQLMPEEWSKRQNIAKRPEWIDNHDELQYVTNDGKTASSICIWKRLKDGAYYEDFFIIKLRLVLEDYGFDGFHGADGYAHPRFPLCGGDFSADMIEQFSMAENIPMQQGPTAEIADRILTDYSYEWMQFHVKRHLQFWRKTVEMLHLIGKKLIFNTAWTRDPFEAKYRYGVDYKALAELGVDTFIVEAPAAVVELEGWNKTSQRVIDEFMSMIMRIKAYVPQCKLILLNCIKDNMEQYNVLRHAPGMLATDVISMTNVFLTRSATDHEACISGIMACLADGISRHEWSMIGNCWDTGFAEKPLSLSGATLIWSDRALENELEYYHHEKICNSHKMLCRLLSDGGSVQSIANIKSLDALTGCIVVIHPLFFPEDELLKIEAYHNGPVIRLGLEGKNNFCCSVCDGTRCISRFTAGKITHRGTAVPLSWLDELAAKTPENSFSLRTVRQISKYSYTERLKKQRNKVKVWGLEMECQSRRIIARNNSFNYATIELDLRNIITAVTPVTEYPCLPVSYHKNSMTFKIPPGNIVVLTVKTLT